MHTRCTQEMPIPEILHKRLQEMLCQTFMMTETKIECGKES